jgi:hypothetical protein
MTLYSLVLFFHVAAVLALFAALSFEVLSLARLRQASSLAELALWMDPVPNLPLVVGSSALVVLLSGIYLTSQIAAFNQAWPAVAMAAFFTDRAAWRDDGQAHSRNSPCLRLHGRNELRTAQSTEQPVSEDLA